MDASVLIVEDDHEIAELIALYFEKEGARTSHAATGEEALESFDADAFDLVLLDINLPATDSGSAPTSMSRNRSRRRCS